MPPPPRKLAKLPEDPKMASTQRMKVAKLYLRNGMNDRAVEILQSLIADYGGTQAAREAKIMLASLRPMK